VIRGDHLIEQLGETNTRLTLVLETTGALSGLVNALYGKQSRRYLELEASSLKRRCQTP
jgi:hypothetical protein